MARRDPIHLGTYNIRSSWASMDTGAYSRSYEPENRPEFRCYVDGQKDAMQKAYDDQIQAQERYERLLLLKQKWLDKGLL